MFTAQLTSNAAHYAFTVTEKYYNACLLRFFLIKKNFFSRDLCCRNILPYFSFFLSPLLLHIPLLTLGFAHSFLQSASSQT